ncbi:MAG TPA: hypothetical protein VH280_19360 [Verrucomicrobiae bacterium]|jgi:hypothetical protein|nr:hypothetical protein [Verrucomicrobiae bacterium]
MQEIEANQNPKFIAGSKRPGQPVMQEKSNIYGRERIKESPSISGTVRIKTHQQSLQRQQYFTGDA